MMNQMMKILTCVIAAFGIGLFVMPAVVQADDGALGTDVVLPWSPDAMSTTGPVPPEGLFRGVAPEALDYEVVIPGVPAYLWLNGCGPTAGGMVMGYWDGQGFDNLVAGSAATQTPEVDNMISSSGNYNDYCLPMDTMDNILPDKSEPPFGDEHPDDCIADFMKTSQSYYRMAYAYTHPLLIDDGLKDYAQFADPHYRVSSEILIWTQFTWDRFRSEIDAGRPMILLVDTDGHVFPDHYVAAIGYGEQGGIPMYACLDTWDHDVHWFEFKFFTPGVPWGFFGAATCSIEYVAFTQISLASPADLSTLSTPPTFTWSVDGGTGNVYAVDLSLSPDFSAFWSTYENMHQLIPDATWAMPQPVWDMVPVGVPVYWRVRGADLDVAPPDIITSDEVWSFTRE